MTNRNVLALFLAILGLATSSATRAESWNYQTYNRDGRAPVGYITLEGSEGDQRIRIVAPGLDTCYQSDLKATVERTDQSIVITVPPALSGCPEIRFVIKADGTGGIRQVKSGETWTTDRAQRLLTIRN